MNLEQLQNTLLFRGMSEHEVSLALKELKSRDREYAKGEQILRAGDVTTEVGLVLSGSVTIESNDIWGTRTILSLAGAGEFFAETYALLPEEPLLVDVWANETCRILFLRIGSLLSEDSTAPWQRQLTRNVLMISAQKNLMLSGRAFHTAPKSARGRIMAYLNSVALRKHSKEFDIPFDRQQMADYLNLDRSALSKELGRMRDEGILAFRKNHFEIKAP